jgi:hypothetical protein
MNSEISYVRSLSPKGPVGKMVLRVALIRVGAYTGGVLRVMLARVEAANARGSRRTPGCAGVVAADDVPAVKTRRSLPQPAPSVGSARELREDHFIERGVSMSKVTKAAVRGVLAVGLLAGVSAVGATSASARALSDSYGCTSSYPEVCLGLYYGGSSGFLSSEQIQGNLDYGVTYRYVLQTPGGGLDESPWATTSKAGWAPS